MLYKFLKEQIFLESTKLDSQPKLNTHITLTHVYVYICKHINIYML